MEACALRDIPGVRDIEAFDLADLIAGSIPINEELFGGSMMYCRIERATALSPEWIRNKGKKRGGK